MQVHSLVNVEIILPYLRAWKKEGHIRYAGITHYEDLYLPPLLSWVERGNLDFVQVHYSISNRKAEEQLLPAAAERGVAVLINMPFGKARLFKVVEGRELPSFASEIGATTWAAFFLKWVISHPHVTCALPFDIKSRPRRRKHRGAAGAAARSRNARTNGELYGEHSRLQPDR
jgi:diketogulonate reductase-like aldo/keto reductase